MDKQIYTKNADLWRKNTSFRWAASWAARSAAYTKTQEALGKYVPFTVSTPEQPIHWKTETKRLMTQLRNKKQLGWWTFKGKNVKSNFYRLLAYAKNRNYIKEWTTKSGVKI